MRSPLVPTRAGAPSSLPRTACTRSRPPHPGMFPGRTPHTPHRPNYSSPSPSDTASTRRAPATQRARSQGRLSGVGSA
eukprot:2953283-Prymnesium_polylepis.1